MPGLRPKATPISFDPAASGYNSPAVRSPPVLKSPKENKKGTTETDFTSDFSNKENQNYQNGPVSNETLHPKEVQPTNTPPPKVAKTELSPPGSNTGNRIPSNMNVVTLPPVKSASPAHSKVGSRKNSIQRYPKNGNKAVYKSDGYLPITLYTDEYKRYPIDMRHSFKPIPKPIDSEDPIADKTTHRVDYVPHPLGKMYKHQYEAWKKPAGDVEVITSYIKDYPAKKIERTKGFKKFTTHAPAGKFEGEPTYKFDFKKWTPIPNERKSLEAAYRPPSGAFQDRTNYTTEYIPYYLQKAASLKPAAEPINSGPFDATTGYMVDYQKHPLPPKFRREKPAYTATKAPLESLTNYERDFTVKEIEKIESCRPKNAAQNSEDPLEKDTTYKVDYQLWEAERPFQHQHDKYVKPDGEIDFGTTSGMNYDHKVGNPAKPIRPVQRAKVVTKFDGIPTYTDDYRKWSTDGMVRVKNDYKYIPSEDKFQGEPTYKRDYIAYREPPRKMLRPIENTIQSGEFDSTTGYKTDFIKYPMEKKEKKEKQKWAKNPAALEAITNYIENYTVKQLSKNPSFKPDGGPQMSEDPFVGSTTHRDDFQNWRTELPFQHQPDKYSKPDGEFDFNTTHNLNYTQKPIIKSISSKPAPRAMDTGKFHDSTTHKDDFKKWSARQRLMPIMKSDSYVPSEGKFEGFPTYKSDFISYKIPERKSFRPIENTQRSTDPLEDKTIYRIEYIQREYPCIPEVPEFHKENTFVGDGGSKLYDKTEPEPLQRTVTVL